jgi:hypothetical protein
MKVVLIAFAVLSVFTVFAQSPQTESATAQDQAVNVSRQVPSGTPLRVYLTKKVDKKKGAPVEAKIMEPVYAFDRQVIPTGTIRGRAGQPYAIRRDMAAHPGNPER